MNKVIMPELIPHKGSNHEEKWLHQLKMEISVLEAKAAEIEKTVKLIPRMACNRELVARCKLEMEEIQQHLAAKKKELEYMGKVELNEVTEQSAAKKKKPEYGDELTEFWKW